MTNYLIAINKIQSNTFSYINTSETILVLNNVHLEDVYVIEIVPSNVVGNGSATTTSVSEYINYGVYLEYQTYFFLSFFQAFLLLVPYQ